MIKKILFAVICLALAASPQPVLAQEKGDAKKEFQELFGKIQAKLKAGQREEKDLTEELKGFDTLLAAHKGEQTDDVAQILFMKALLYLEVFKQSDKGVEMLKQLKTDFPETQPAKSVDKVIESIARRAEAQKNQESMIAGAKFPDFDEKDVKGKPVSIAAYKGKLVLVDFWATWCGPCVGELPNVIATYEKYHDKGFEVVGISLDRELKSLTDFTSERKMPWQQFFDGEGKLATKYGIESIPSTFLLDGEGKIIARNLRGEALAKAVGEALAKK